MSVQNLNPGQDTRAETKLEGHRNQIKHSEGAMSCEGGTIFLKPQARTYEPLAVSLTWL